MLTATYHPPTAGKVAGAIRDFAASSGVEVDPVTAEFLAIVAERMPYFPADVLTRLMLDPDRLEYLLQEGLYPRAS